MECGTVTSPWESITWVQCCPACVKKPTHQSSTPITASEVHPFTNCVTRDWRGEKLFLLVCTGRTCLFVCFFHLLPFLSICLPLFLQKLSTYHTTSYDRSGSSLQSRHTPSIWRLKQRGDILPQSDSAGPAGLPPDKRAPQTEVDSSTHILHQFCIGFILLVITAWVKRSYKCIKKVTCDTGSKM